MSRSYTTRRTICVLGAAVLLGAGCGGGGGDEGAAPPADAGTSPTPGATTPGGTVADPAATTTPGATTPGATDGAATTPTIDPTTGQPVPAPAAAPAATIPDLIGDDIKGGLASVAGSAFDSKATSPLETAATTTDTVKIPTVPTLPTTSVPTTTTPTETKATVVYTSAKIYVNGMTHTVAKGAAFPKGSPVFRLLSISANDIEIELIAGQFTTGGGEGTFLDKGDLVSLVNSSEQLTYRVKYLRPIAGSNAISF